MAVPTKTLNNGEKMPVLGLGTWQGGDDPSVVGNAIKYAIDAGYRHFDCAYIYGNEDVIGEAIREKIKEGVVKREDLFIVTKLWNTFHKKELVVPNCKKSLKNFGLDYIDLYLIHWPMSYPEDSQDLWSKVDGGIDYCETWKGMEECVKLNLTKSIGVSNFNSQQIDQILAIAEIKPVVNQVECHPNLNQKKLREFCAAKNIAITAYSPFGSPKRVWAKTSDSQVTVEHPTILSLAEKYKKSPCQVVIRYLIDIGTIPIPKSSSKERIEQNINVFDFKLTPEEIAEVDKLDCGIRICPAEPCKSLKYYPFHIEF